MDNGQWVKVGSFGVDAGLCWLGDPCYLDNTHEASMHNWDNFCSKLEYSKEPLMQEFHDGCVVSTGFGDGCYEVWAKVKDFGDWGKRIVEVKAIFVSEDEDEEN